MELEWEVLWDQGVEGPQGEKGAGYEGSLDGVQLLLPPRLRCTIHVVPWPMPRQYQSACPEPAIAHKQ